MVPAIAERHCTIRTDLSFVAAFVSRSMFSVVLLNVEGKVVLQAGGRVRLGMNEMFQDGWIDKSKAALRFEMRVLRGVIPMLARVDRNSCFII